MAPISYPRVNIYLGEPGLREAIQVAAARQGMTISAYCLEAIRCMADEGLLPAGEADRLAAATALDRLRRQIGPIGVPVRRLVAEGRRR
ncbi:MAG: hypothetical protein HYU88_13810 [Chloroflexi bacterium]|nr:hypothetical protein [Chloroflexota bacterium]MBI4505160.1 hypothetical protein [Chloroflexota bacterium]